MYLTPVMVTIALTELKPIIQDKMKVREDSLKTRVGTKEESPMK